MTVGIPYLRMARPVGDPGSSWDGGVSELSYVRQSGFGARDRLSLLRSYRVLESDLTKLFDYIEPHDLNAHAFSYRTYELLLRAATEVESHCKAILIANNVPKPHKGWNIVIYGMLEGALRLADYAVRLPEWTEAQVGNNRTDLHTGFCPFDGWVSSSPAWWKAYNSSKHNRADELKQATVQSAVAAVSAVQVLLFAQFGPSSLSEATGALGMYLQSDDGWVSFGGHFQLKPPSWPQEECYSFDIEQWKADGQPYQAYKFEQA